MSLFDRWFRKSPLPAPESLPGREGEPQREEPAASPSASTVVPPAPTSEPPKSSVVPPGHQIVQVAVPGSLAPSVELLKGGVCVAFLGQGSDEPVEELESLLRQLEPWMKDSQRLSLLSQEKVLSQLFGPSPSTIAVPRVLLWVFSRRALCGWLEEPANLQALLRHLYRLKSSAQPVAQFVCFEHDCGPGAAVLARLLIGLGLNVRVLEPDPQRYVLLEVHRPDGVVLTALMGHRFPREGAVDDFPASVNAEKARAEAQGDVLRLWQLEQWERDYLVRALQPIQSQLRELPQLRAPRLCRLLRTVVDQASPTARKALEKELLRRTLPLLLLMKPDCKSMSVAHFHGIGPALRAYPDHDSLLRTVKDLEMAEGSYGIGGMSVRDVFDSAAAGNISLALNVYLTPYTPTYVFWLPEDARLLAQGKLASNA
ncbi:hypothetical protein [Archangium sp.]|uniref:hypothetical protein n=1 Tax=Archangium sp. TaxID=1872627 RepID=UPI002D46B75D|nr:hypothetical protein [Archangium sp.]HYO54291.1 hypothetical protein [Archangium sp.]